MRKPSEYEAPSDYGQGEIPFYNRTQLGGQVGLRAGGGPGLIDTERAYLDVYSSYLQKDADGRIGWAQNLYKHHEPVEGYSPLEDIRGTQYEEYSWRFIGFESPEDTAVMKARIDSELKSREILEAAGLGSTIGAMGIGLILDPLTWLPVLGFSKAATAGQNIKRMAILGGVETGIEQSAVYASHPTMSPTESLLMIGASTFLSGTMGGFMSRASRKSREKITLATERAFQDMTAAENKGFDAAMDRAGERGPNARMGLAGEQAPDPGDLGAMAKRSPLEPLGSKPGREHTVEEQRTLEVEFRERLDEIGIGDRVVPEANNTVNWGGVKAPSFLGAYFPNQRMIQVAMNIAKDPMEIFNHEIIHALRHLGDPGAIGSAVKGAARGLFTGSEWAILESAARRDVLRFKAVSARYAGLSLEGRIEEVIADQFTLWKGGHFEPETEVGKIFKKIKNFFEASYQFFRGHGYKTAEDVWKDIEAGTIGRRASALTPEEEAGLQVRTLHRQNVERDRWLLKKGITPTKVTPEERAKLEKVFEDGKERLKDRKKAMDKAHKDFGPDDPRTKRTEREYNMGRMFQDARQDLLENMRVELEERTAMGQAFPAMGAKAGDDLNPDKIAARKLAEAEAAAAAAIRQYEADMAGNSIEPAFGLEKLLKPTTPVTRLLTSPELMSRETVQQIADIPFYLVKHFTGQASERPAENLAKQWLWPVVESFNDTSRLYVKMRGQDGGGAVKVAQIRYADWRDSRTEMSYLEFRNQIGKAMRLGDEHEIPEVAEAAKIFRKKVLEPMRKEAEELDLFTEGLRREHASVSKKLEPLKKTAGKGDRSVDVQVRNMEQRLEAIEKRIEAVRGAANTVETAQTYFPRIWRVDVILDRETEFREILHGYFQSNNRKMSIEELDALVDETFEKIIRDRPYTPISDDAAGITSAVRERTLLIPDALVVDFLESDVESVMGHHARSLGADIELTRKFGSIDMREKLEEIEASWKLRIAEAEQGERGALRKQRDSDLKDIRALRDRLRGTYGLSSDPLRMQSRFYRVAKQINSMTMLGGATISALSDVARPLMVEGFSRTFRSGLKAMFQDPAMFRLAGRESRWAGTALDIDMAQRGLALADVGDAYGRHTKFERQLSRANSAFFLANLLSPWTAAMKSFASVIIGARIIEDTLQVARTVAADAAYRTPTTPVRSLSESSIAKLARGGISQDDAVRIAAQYQKYGYRDREIYFANTNLWDDIEAVKAFRNAMLSDIDRTIVTPGIGDRPLWVSTELGGVIGQFKSFAFSSTQRVLLAGLQERDMSTLNGMALLVGMGLIADAIKKGQYDDNREFSIGERLVDGIDRSGVLGFFTDINNAVERLSDNRVGVRPFAFGSKGYKPSTRTKMGVFGPTASQIANYVDIISDWGSGTHDEGTARALRRATIGQTLFYVDGLFDAVERGVGSL
jgi:hypothetical protein